MHESKARLHSLQDLGSRSSGDSRASIEVKGSLGVVAGTAAARPAMAAPMR